MTKSKRAFAEMFAAAQGREGDTSLIDELCEKYTMIDIIYEMKKYEEQHQPEPEPPKEPEPEPPKEPETEPPKDPEPEPPKDPEPEPKPRFEPTNFWSRLSSDE